MTTAKSRQKRIADALGTYEDRTGHRETLTLEWRGHQEILPVVELRLEDVLLNARSHRLKAQLEDHPHSETVASDPWGDDAQAVIADLIRTAHRDFIALRANLRDEGQRDAGVVTRDGILFNGNSRAVALRELEEESKGTSWIRVAVLPADADERELAELELRLQVQKELKDAYTLTNELLFIEDLTRNYSKTPEQIALDLRWATTDPKSRKKAAGEVEQRRRILALIREMQAVPSKPIQLTFFDDKLEQLKAIETKYSAMVKDDPEAARRFRDNWLLASRAGSSSVHDLRAVDEDFVGDLLRSHLEADPLLGDHVEELLAPTKGGKRADPPGVGILDPDQEAADEGDTDVRRILDIFSSNNKVSFQSGDGKKLTYDPEPLREAIRAATKSAIQEFKLKGRHANRLEEPTALMREAVFKLRKARTKYGEVAKDLGQGRRGKFQYQVSQAKKAVTELEKTLEPGSKPPRSKR